MVLALAMAFRPQATADLGYHLAYGDSVLSGRGIVGDARLVHPPPTPEENDGNDLPPGAWFDGAGRYRFPNANWLSQVVIAAVYRVAGGVGLTLLGVCLTALLLLAQAAAVRRCGLGPGWVAAVWLVTAAVSYERLNVRPELFGYVCLMITLWLVTGPLGWRRFITLLAVQAAAANLHGYWPLGVGVAGAFALDAVLRLGWERWRRGGPVAGAEKRRAVLLALAPPAMFLAAFITPFGWRSALLPFQTIAFLRRHNIVGSSTVDLRSLWSMENVHPWSLLGEFHHTFDPPFLVYWSTDVFAGLIICAVAASIVLLLRGRIGWLLITAAMIEVGLSMRRNLAPAALLLAPAVAVAGGALSSWLARRLDPPKGGLPFSSRMRAVAVTAVSVVLIVAAAWWTGAVVTNALYLSGGWPNRFGAGISRLTVPLDTCRWLDERLETPRPVFTDANLASNLVYFSDAVSAVPLLSNTWAAPVSRMRRVFALGLALEPFAEAAAEAGWDIAVLDTAGLNRPLIRGLDASPGWALVRIEPQLVVFVRRTGALERLISEEEQRRGTFDTAALLARARELDGTRQALDRAVLTLEALGWNEAAAEARAAIDGDC